MNNTIFEILGILCDDDETLETIVGILHKSDENYNLKNVLPVILDLYNKGMVTIAYPKDVKEADREQLNEYWFSITKKGKEFFDTNNPF